jgi:type II secretory pathway pseudopilin PulG
MKCTAHRIFLASLILAAKNLNDSSPKNKHWARYTAVRGFDNFGFSLTEVNLMEKQLLGLLEWDLRVTEDDLYFHLEPFLAPIRAWQHRQAEKQRVREEMAALEQRQIAFAAQQQRYAANEYTYQQPMYYAASSNSSSRAPSRTPSLSPPSRSQSSASIFSADSYGSQSSPASIASSYTDSVCAEPAVHIQQYEGQHIPSIVHIQSKHVPTALPHAHSLPLEQTDQQPLKKQKTNIFSRFLPTTLSRAAPMNGY